ncbi:TonB C-terminal domain-containing protein [Candidatus Fermentibacterales bacterium]|nr:TonB C-terminal domain-containing protein [Candidatus Fermentibacterales bacterium]
MSRSLLLYSLVGHVAVILLGLLVSSGGASAPLFGGEAISVSMVSLAEPGAVLHPEVGPVAETPVEEQAEVVEEVQEVLSEDQVDVVEEQAEQVEELQETPVEEVEETPVEEQAETATDEQSSQESGAYSSIDGSGEPGGSSFGPASYEGRVFAAIRRNFRTSVQPSQSYRITFRVNPDGTIGVTTLRTSGVDVFDRAVESAIRLASIPPFPYGRTEAVVLNIEFLGPPE